MPIPVIDLFAGPGGLGEGFSSVFNEVGDRGFNNVLSIEMEELAHRTLTLRSFYRQFNPRNIPEQYYDVLRGDMTDDELYSMEEFRDQSEAAKNEAKRAKLGFGDDSTSPVLVDEWITAALNGEEDWVLTGGPPCQAYSVVGRSRRQQTTLNADTDERVDLYRQYLRIIDAHRPSVFVMENVKGMLSARSATNSIFRGIMEDLKAPGYKIFSLVSPPKNDLYDNPEYDPRDFIIRAEEYGIPQARHRVILVGIRNDFYTHPPELLSKKDPVPINSVISDLPRIRSGLSKMENTWVNWETVLKKFAEKVELSSIDKNLWNEIELSQKKLRNPKEGSGNNFIKKRKDAKSIVYEPDWFKDERIGGYCNHESRGHMNSDILRYMFVSSFGKIHGRSPKLEDFPKDLLPAHKNVQEGIKNKKFADRFRVQLSNKPAKTITSHISKDGHYYIHPDPTQCRSLTVREAARIQTFPDNYFFCGPRTSQYIQVGNAVPPLLALKIAKIIKLQFD